MAKRVAEVAKSGEEQTRRLEQAFEVREQRFLDELHRQRQEDRQERMALVDSFIKHRREDKESALKVAENAQKAAEVAQKSTERAIMQLRDEKTNDKESGH